MELDADYISYTNILNGYITMLEENLINLTYSLKECQNKIQKINEAILQPKSLYKIKEYYFEDEEGNKPIFFEKENGERYEEDNTTNFWIGCFHFCNGDSSRASNFIFCM